MTVKTTKYVAFVDNDDWGGFTSLISWNNNPAIHSDIDRVIEFDGPFYEPGTDVEADYRVWEEITRLSKKVVEDDLQKVPLE